MRIVGKIELPDLPEKSKWNIYDRYLHFAQRLKERYKMDITLKEYRSLCKAEHKMLAAEKHNLRPKQKVLKVAVVFKGVEVHGIKYSKGGLLVTALPFRK